MRYGNLSVFVGPMFAGKTEDLVKEILFRTYFASSETRDSNVRVYKPLVDDRFDAAAIISHNGARAEATPISCFEEIDRIENGVVFFDEIQFFSRPHFEGSLPAAIRDLRRRGTDVFCAGLDMDYLGHAFEVSSVLMAEASDLHRLTALCDTCGGPATHTVRHEMTAERILLGSSENYAPMCAQHWARARASTRLRQEILDERS